MDLGLKDKVALVAASSSGLGKATALALVNEGAKVVICGRDKNRLDTASRDISTASDSEVFTCVADVTKSEDIDELVRSSTDKFGTIHILINNAGGPPPGVFWDTPDEDWENAFNLTLMSTVRLTRAVLPFMRQQKWGRIINITSMTTKQPINELLLSNSLRLGVIGWAKTLANQMAAEGILINNVCPGWTKTERVTQLIKAKAQAENTSSPEEEKKIVF